MRIEKKPGLSPASYDPQPAFNKTQRSVQTYGFGKGKTIVFSDKIAKAKKFVPPPGQYNYQPCEAKVTKPFCKKRR